MILAWLALLSATASGGDVVTEARLALSHGRTVQAREMISAAVRDGASGAMIDRLLADLAFAEKRWAEATVRYDGLIGTGARDAGVFEKAAAAALHQANDRAAAAYLDRALALPEVSWRAYNLRGVLADRAQDWAAADAAYAEGLRLDPASADLHNNLGWSLLLRGQWAEAHRHLEQAAALAPGNQKIAANRDLAVSALDADLPERRAGESGAAFAARLNDSGVLALRAGQEAKARAAFARALEESDRWFERAANNLAMAGSTALPER